MSQLTVDSHSSVERFLEAMEPLLLQDEARYGLMLGIALVVRRRPERYLNNPPYFAIAQDDAGVAAAACMTPPYGIIVHSERSDSDPGLRAIAQDLLDRGWTLPTANGPEPFCTHFAQIWSAMAKVPYKVGVSERTFELRHVIHPTYSPGQLRQATENDAEILTQWQQAFIVEALPESERRLLEEIGKEVHFRINAGMLYLWDDGEPVCYAGITRPTTHGIAIGPVYTPPHFRGKGYASSAVAALSQLQLDQGRQFCTLFTDLANRTSNSIYQRIGYKPICDYTVYSFGQ